MFSPQLVLACLLKDFGSCNITRTPSREEQKVINSFAAILREASYNNPDINCEEEFEIDDTEIDPTWNADDDESSPATSAGSIRFGNVEVSEDLVEKALSFYRSSEEKSRSLSSMNAKFRFISSPYHLEKLRQIEKEREIIADREVRLRDLAEKLKEIVWAKFEMGISLHDNDIRRMALQINQEIGVEGFKACRSWIGKFKKNFGIVSRRVTTFISRKFFLESEKRVAEAEAFVLSVKKELETWPLTNVCNADQSAFLKEMHSARSLAPKGVKKVERIVQSVLSTTHSFTVMPIIYADGHLGQKLFVILQEPHGKFPNRGIFQTHNLEVRANVTHMMNKGLLLDWIRSCLMPSNGPPTLLLVESWSAFKDHDAMKSALPNGAEIKIMNIPPGTTSSIQPLDVYFFLPFKAMYKRFTSYVITHNLDFSVHARDSILRVHYPSFTTSFALHVSEIFWHTLGINQVILDRHPEQFETPLQYCFSPDLIGNCSVNCSDVAFIQCAYCESSFCFNHFVLSYHICH